ncbi:hypothetical protein [Arcticibacter eurypsychrophilus]|nr:hypothetical protein [Arcticibacter eurypsychrophilus]
MTTLIVNIDNQTSVKAVKAFLESMGLSYSVDTNVSTHAWWEDESLVQELERRSEDLKSGKDKGVSFEEIKQNLNRS